MRRNPSVIEVPLNVVTSWKDLIMDAIEYVVFTIAVNNSNTDTLMEIPYQGKNQGYSNQGTPIQGHILLGVESTNQEFYNLIEASQYEGNIDTLELLAIPRPSVKKKDLVSLDFISTLDDSNITPQNRKKVSLFCDQMMDGAGYTGDQGIDFMFTTIQVQLNGDITLERWKKVLTLLKNPNYSKLKRLWDNNLLGMVHHELVHASEPYDRFSRVAVFERQKNKTLPSMIRAFKRERQEWNDEWADDLYYFNQDKEVRAYAISIFYDILSRMILWDRKQITSRQFTAYLHKSVYFRIVAPYLLRKKYNRLVAMVIEYLRRANKFRTTEKESPVKQNPDKIELRLAMVQKDLSEQEAKYYKLKERLNTLKSEYRQLLNIYHNLEEPDDYFEDELQEYDYLIPALQSELDELKAELEHYNVKLKHNPPKRNPTSSLGSIAIAGLAGFLLGKK